eukprot:SAG11_NODE_19472_length_465_cov_75.147541_2_plen_51_part_00
MKSKQPKKKNHEKHLKSALKKGKITKKQYTTFHTKNPKLLMAIAKKSKKP